MNEEIKKAFEEVRAALGKNTVAQERVDQLAQEAAQRDANLKNIQAELEQIRAQHQETQAALTEMKRKSRQQGIEADGVHDQRSAWAMLGMMARRKLAEFARTEIPSEFAHEREILDAYHKRCLETRTTISAGAVTGSYLVPTFTESNIIDTLEEVSDLVSRVDFLTGLPGNVNIPTLTGRSSLKPTRATVATTMTAGDPTFGQVSLTPAEAYCYFPADNRLLLMSAVDLGRLLQPLLVDSAIAGIADWLLNGDGTSTYNSITGILNESTAAYIYQLGSGKTTFTSMEFTDFVQAMNKCLKRGRARGSWLAAFDVAWSWGDITRGDGKAPVLSYPGGMAEPMALLKPIIIEEGMPDLTTADQSGVAFCGFGDLATYIVGLQGGMQLGVSTEYLFGINQTAYRLVMNMDIKRKPAATFVTLKTAAA
jgi:HK97 family phage major capsid protein